MRFRSCANCADQVPERLTRCPRCGADVASRPVQATDAAAAMAHAATREPKNERRAWLAIGASVTAAVVGWGYATWAGALTGLLSVHWVASSLAMLSRSGVEGQLPRETSLGSLQRAAAFVALVASVSGALHGGWVWG